MQTIVQLLRREETCAAAITMLGKTVELCADQVAAADANLRLQSGLQSRILCLVSLLQYLQCSPKMSSSLGTIFKGRSLGAA